MDTATTPATPTLSPLLAELQRLEPDIRRHFIRHYPDVPTGALKFRVLSEPSSHPLVAVESPAAARPRLLMKCRRKHDRISQSLQTEQRVLMDVAPKLAASNDATRCPAALAYYPEEQMLLMELVDGPRLDMIQFGAARSTVRIPDLLELCAKWLAGFHALTESSETGNPFDWVAELFDHTARRHIFEGLWSKDRYADLRQLVEVLRRRHSGLKLPRCLVHGEFAPYHVLVANESIYVIDLASARESYPFQDLGYFCAFFDALLPWRRALGALRMDPMAQQRHFLRCYFRERPELGEASDALTRLAHLQAMIPFFNHSRVRDSWKTTLYSMIAKPWARHRFHVVCERESAALRALAGQ